MERLHEMRALVVAIEEMVMMGRLARLLVALAMALLLVLTLAACGDDAASTGGGDDNQDNQTNQNQSDRACDSGDDCEEGEICVRSSPDTQGVCEEPLVDPPLGVGEECSESAECETGLCYDGVCTKVCESVDDCPEDMACRSAGDDVAVCAPKQKCDSAADCDDDICVVDRNGEVELYCNLPVGPGGPGESCDVDEECEAGLCLDGVCSAPCEGPADCEGDETFQCSGQDLGDGESTDVCLEAPAEYCLSDDECIDDDERCVAAVDDVDEVAFMCGEPNEGGAEGGGLCDDHNDCAQNLCHDGACQAPCYDDEMCSEIPGSACTVTDVVLDGAQGTVHSCEVPVICDSPVDCEADETCWVERGDDAVLTTCEMPEDGERADGEPCADDSECASNYCHDDRYENYCATPCETDDDCPADVGGLAMSCETTDIEHGSGSDAVDVCLREKPEGCSTDDDCAGGQACAVVADQKEGGVATVCLPDNDGMQTGMPCDENSDCASRYCIDDTCTTPCETYEHCDLYQVCDVESVVKDGESGALDLCVNLEFTACMSPSDCDPENTTCNAPTYDADGFVDGAACGFSNPGQANLGAECDAMTDCESNYCWASDNGSTGECTVFCQDSVQDCAGEQSCVAMIDGLGACLGDCERNADCDGGNVCQLGTDPDNTELYRYCGNTLPGADKVPGDECTNFDDCDNGLCLTVTTHEVLDVSCTSDFDCDPGYECSCPPGEPGCIDQVCVSETGTVEQRCSELCDPANGNADCEGQGHELTECSTTVDIIFGDVETTTAACSFPAQ